MVEITEIIIRQEENNDEMGKKILQLPLSSNLKFFGCLYTIYNYVVLKKPICDNKKNYIKSKLHIVIHYENYILE